MKRSRMNLTEENLSGRIKDASNAVPASNLCRFCAHSKYYLKTAASSESCLPCPMLVEKPRDEDISMKEANKKRDYMRYTVQDKARSFDLEIEKCMGASATAKQLGIHIQT
ncbi:unnamed protein product [Rhizopus stolonifer]